MYDDREERPARRRRATSAERREQQLIADAYDLAEKQIKEGSASAMVVTHFLKLGTTRERLEQKRIEQENLLAAAKIKSLERQANSEQMYSEALNAMRRYAGQANDEEYED